MKLKLLLLLIVGLYFSSSLSFSDSNGIWTYAEDIVGGEFGSDESVNNFTFSDVVYFNEDLIYKSTRIEDLFINRSGDTMYGNLRMTSRFILLDEDNNNDWGFISEAGQGGVGLLGNSARYPVMDLYVEHSGEVRVNNNNLNLNSNSIENVSELRGDRITLSSQNISELGGVYAEAYFTRDFGSQYYLRPAELSILKDLNVDTSIIYRGDELDDRFVNEGQSNSISSGMIQDGSITINDLNWGSIDSRYVTKGSSTHSNCYTREMWSRDGWSYLTCGNGEYMTRLGVFDDDDDWDDIDGFRVDCCKIS